MSKRAEEAAMKAYPVHEGASPQWIKHHLSGGDCAVFIQGYEQAEKDLKLTADDIGAILELYLQMMRDEKYRNIGREAICDEVLKRFYELDKNEQPNLS